MRASVLALSMLAANAAAWRWPGSGQQQQQCSQSPAQTVTVTVTANAPAVPTTADAAQPTSVPGGFITIPTGGQDQPSTLVTRKSTTAVSIPRTTTAVSQPEPTKQPSGDSSGLTADQKASLDAHNAARAEVGTPALSWDASLVADAQAYADKLAASGQLVHSGVKGLGENLYMQSNSDNAMAAAVKAFVSEKSMYNGEVIDSSNYMKFGHYTQVIWKSTTKVALAAAKGPRGTFVVARYSPPGNYIGQKPY